MKFLQQLTLKFSWIAVLTALTSSAYSGTPPPPVVTYGPANGIPTLSAVMLVVLSLLLFVVAVRISKQKGYQKGKFFITLLGATALVSGIGGVKLVSEADAVTFIGVQLTDGSSGSHTQPFDLNVINAITNSTTPAVPVTIQSISYNGCPDNPVANRCTVGTGLAVGADCKIDCTVSTVLSCDSDADCVAPQICIGIETDGPLIRRCVTPILN